MPRDLFSAGASQYKNFRPTYPAALYQYILSFVTQRQAALDVATGNGQAALALAPYFDHVTAIDTSAAQLAQAPPKENITYRQATAEATFSKPHAFDLITVAQAYHWFNIDAFAAEVARVARPGAVVAVWGYDRITTKNTELNTVLDHFYTTVVGPYWDAARRHVESHYATLPFPFKRLPSSSFAIDAEWNARHLLGYLESWSAVQTYTASVGQSPLPQISDAVTTLLQDKPIAVTFPVFLHLGTVAT